MKDTLGDVRALLYGLPDDTPVEIIHVEKPNFVFLVDGNGVARRVTRDTKRAVLIHVQLPING